MGSVRRAMYFITGLGMVAGGVLSVVLPEVAVSVILLVLRIWLTLAGIRYIVYYISMARHMVDGIYIFYKGIFLFDVGIFSLCFENLPPMYAMMFLVFNLAVAGGVDVMRANEQRKLEVSDWLFKMLFGIFQILIALACFFFLNSVRAITIVYGVGLGYSGIVRIILAFRRRAIVYTQ